MDIGQWRKMIRSWEHTNLPRATKKKLFFYSFFQNKKKIEMDFILLLFSWRSRSTAFFFFTGPVIFLFVLLSGIFLMVNACQLYIKKYIYKYKIITCLCVVGSKFMYGRWKKKYRKKWNHSRRPRRDTPPPQMNGWIY